MGLVKSPPVDQAHLDQRTVHHAQATSANCHPAILLRQASHKRSLLKLDSPLLQPSEGMTSFMPS